MKSYIKKISIKNLLMLFLILSPVFDTVFFYSRLTTLIRISIITFFFLITLFQKEKNSGIHRWLFLYTISVLSYLIINFIRSKSFISLVPDNFNYSILSEALTMWKLATPIMLIYTIKCQNTTKMEIIKILNFWVLLIAGSIIISNVLELSLSSYSDGIIKASVFKWSKLIEYKYTASKGFFNYANQEAVIMLILLCISLYEFFYMEKKYFVNVFLLIVATIMLGTRVSSIGGFVVLLGSTLCYLSFCILKREKPKKYILLLCIPIVIWALLIPISPYQNRSIELNQSAQFKNTNVNEVTSTNKESDEKKIITKIDFVYANFNENYLPKIFFEKYYPIKYDIDFWYDFIKKYTVNEINYRMIEENIIKRVWKVDNKKSNCLFGIGNSRIQNIVNLERDFKLHFYAFGLIGSIILLVPYYLTILSGAYLFIRERNYYSLMLVGISILYITISYLSGNIINSITTIIAYSTFVSLIYVETNEPKIPIKG